MGNYQRYKKEQYSLTPSPNGVLTQEEFLKAFVKEQYETQRGLYGYISNKLLRREIIRKTIYVLTKQSSNWKIMTSF